jgi:hypothetical protein
MSDYQAIYDAVRSRISGGNIGDVIRDVAWQQFDMSHARAMAQQEIAMVGYEMARPATVMRPGLSIDGDKWCALYGESLQDGVAGFGASPAEAMTAFDKAWHEKLPARTMPDLMKMHDETVAMLRDAQ